MSASSLKPDNAAVVHSAQKCQCCVWHIDGL